LAPMKIWKKREECKSVASEKGKQKRKNCPLRGERPRGRAALQGLISDLGNPCQTLGPVGKRRCKRFSPLTREKENSKKGPKTCVAHQGLRETYESSSGALCQFSESGPRR